MPAMTALRSNVAAKPACAADPRSVAAHASSGARFGNSRWENSSSKARADSKRGQQQAAAGRSGFKTCGPMMTPLGPFFGMEMGFVDPMTPMGQQRCGPGKNSRQWQQRWGPTRRMLIDIEETDDAFEVFAELPGVDKSNIKVDVDGDALVISVHDAAASLSATQTSSRAADNDATDAASAAGAAGAAAKDAEGSESASGKRGGRRQVHRRERSTAFADRTLRMPDSADMDAISAEHENGVLTVRVQKRAESQRRQVPIA